MANKRNLIQIEEAHTSIFEAIAEAVIVVNSQGKIIFANDKTYEIFQFPNGSLLNQDLDCLIPEEFKKSHKQYIQSYNEDPHSRQMKEVHAIRNDLSEFPVQVSLSPIIIENEHCVVAIILDISARKKVEEELKTSESRLRQAMSIARLGIWEWDVATDITTWHGHMFEMYGISEDEFTGKGSDYFEFTHPDDRQIQQDNIGIAFERGVTSKQLQDKNTIVPYNPKGFRIVRPNGEICHVEGDAVAVIDDEGNPIRMIGLIMDITERKQAEENLHQAELLKAQLAHEQELTEIKNRFVGMLSHELRTPLAVLNTTADLLNNYYERLTAERRRHHLASIKAEIANLSKLLEDVLIVSKTGAIQTVIEPTLTDIVVFCGTIYRKLGLDDDPRFSFQADVLGEFEIDQTIVEHFLNNLLNNAQKYTPEDGQISLKINQEDSHLVFEVADTGIGIPEDDQIHLFSPFHRASNVDSIKGTGLGLTITKTFVERYGGTVNFESQEGEGSTFIVKIPLI